MATRYVEIPAAAIDTFLTERRFVRADNGRTERIYERAGKEAPSLRLVVWSSVSADGTTARDCGEDAIRVALVAAWKGQDGESRRWPLHKCKRIHRTGSVEKVLDRVKDRLLEAAEASKRYGKACGRCGAPTWADSGRCIDRKCIGSPVAPVLPAAATAGPAKPAEVTPLGHHLRYVGVSRRGDVSIYQCDRCGLSGDRSTTYSKTFASLCKGSR